MARSRNTRRRQGGGGVGATYGFAGGNAFSQTINNPIMATSAPSTEMAAARPGFMSGAPAGNGLPGLNGGGTRKACKHRCGGKCKHKCCKKKSRGSRRRSSRLQSGGRYGFDGAVDGTVNGPHWGAGIASTMRLPCEASLSAPVTGGASGTLNMRGGELWDSPPRQGGGGPMVTGAPATEAYNAQTAGYTQLGGNEMDNSIVTSSGTRLMVNQPFDARGGNPDCLKGGARRRKSKKVKRRN
jgi:hypothetical protein